MTEYVVSRTRAWLTDEEFAASVDCLPAIRAQFSEHVRLVRSCVFREEDGALSAHCYYEATSPAWIEKLSEAAMLPCDFIRPVTATFAAA